MSARKTAALTALLAVACAPEYTPGGLATETAAIDDTAPASCPEELPGTGLDEDCDGLVDELEAWPGQVFLTAIPSDPATQGQHTLVFHGEATLEGQVLPWSHELDPLYHGPEGLLYGIVPLTPSGLGEEGWDFEPVAVAWELVDLQGSVVDSGLLQIEAMPPVDGDPVASALELIDAIEGQVTRDDHLEILDAIGELVQAGQQGPTALVEVDGAAAWFGPQDLDRLSLALVHASDSALRGAAPQHGMVPLSDHLASVYGGGAPFALTNAALASGRSAGSLAPTLAPWMLAQVTSRTLGHVAGSSAGHEKWTERSRASIGLLRVSFESAAVGEIGFTQDYARLLLHSKAMTCVSPFGACQSIGGEGIRSASWACGMEWEEHMPQGCTLTDTDSTNKRLECACELQ